MDKIENYETVIKCLKRGEILVVAKPLGLYFALKGVLIQAKNDQSMFTLSWESFGDLFGEAEFYLYEKKEEALIDKQKDDEYYQWKHK